MLKFGKFLKNYSVDVSLQVGNWVTKKRIKQSYNKRSLKNNRKKENKRREPIAIGTKTKYI